MWPWASRFTSPSLSLLLLKLEMITKRLPQKFAVEIKWNLAPSVCSIVADVFAIRQFLQGKGGLGWGVRGISRGGTRGDVLTPSEQGRVITCRVNRARQGC